MKKLLMIAPYFLPRRRVGAYRPFKFAIHLREFGWQPTVVTIAENGGNLTPKENYLLEEIAVSKLSPPFDLTQTHSASQLNNRGDKKKGDAGSFISNSITKPLANFIDRNFPVDTWLPFFYLKRKRIIEIVQKVTPDLIWATGDPWSGLWIGSELKRICSIPYVADFRDPWTLSEVRMRGRSSMIKKWDRRKEREILGRSDAAVFTAEKTESIYNEYYSDLDLNSYTVYNSFDRTLYEDEIGIAPEKDSRDKSWDDTSLHLAFFGKFRELSPARPLIDILSELHKRTDTSPSVKIHSYGSLNDGDRQYAARRSVEHHFVRERPVSPESALSELRKADILLLSTSENRDEIIPAKLWDYIAAGKPILSVAPNAEIAGILEDTGTGVQFSPEKKRDAASFLKKCVEAKRDGHTMPFPFSYNEDRILKFESKSTTEKLAQIFNNIV